MLKFVTLLIIIGNLNLLSPFYFPCCYVGANWADTQLKAQVKDVSDALDQFVNVNLGVQHLQNHLSKITSTKTVTQQGSDILKTFRESLQEKVQLANDTLGSIIEAIKNDYKGPGDGDNKPIQSCCDYDQSKTKYSSLFKTKVNFDDICGFASIDQMFCPSQLRTFENKIHRLSRDMMLKKMKSSYTEKAKRLSRHIYLGTTDGYFIGYPADYTGGEKCQCAAFDPRYRPWFPNIVNTREGKEYVVAVDFSSSMGPRLLVKAKQVVNNLLRIIDTKDMIALRILSDDSFKAATEYKCLHSLTEAHPSVIKVLKDFTSNSVTGGLLHYTKIFKTSFRLFSKNNNKKKLFILVTSGDYNEHFEEQVKIEFRNAVAVQCDVRITTFLVQESGSPLSKQTIQEHEQLRQEACNGACRNNRNCDSKDNFQLVHVYTGDNEADIRQKVSKVYNAFMNDLGTPELMFTMPYEDFYGLGTMIDACIRVVDDQMKLLAVLCLSFLSNELFGITAEFSNTGDAYPFLIDNSGTTYIHPYYVDPILHDSGNRIDITNFEASEEFVNHVYQSMKSGGKGTRSFIVNSSKPLGIFGAKFESKSFTYIWEKVDNSSFSVGVAVSSSYKNNLRFLSSQSTQGNELYHRLSKQTGIQGSLCRHKGYIATKEKPVICLASDVFEQPSVYPSEETNSSIQILAEYFNMNPSRSPAGFKSSTIRSNVRQDVMSTNLMNEFWLNDISHQTNIIVWRYIGMQSGVMRIYPGIELPNFDPRKQLWYQLAETLPGKLVFTPPYVNSKGETIFSINKYLVKDLNGVQQGTGVIGMDFNSKYFDFLMERDLTICGGHARKGNCSIINTDGYFLFRKDVPDVSKNVHLVEKEPKIANIFLTKGIMQKRSCVEYNNRLPRIIWFYSLDHIKISHTDNKTYWLLPVHGTNLLLLWTENKVPDQSKCSCNEQSGGKEIIGPCKDGVDSQTSCECPCYTEKACLNELFENDAKKRNTLICQPRSFQQSMPMSSDLVNVMKDRQPLPDCFPLNCSEFKRSDECTLYGCKWGSKTCSPDKTVVVSDTGETTSILIIVIIIVTALLIVAVLVIFFVVRCRNNARGLSTNKPPTTKKHQPERPFPIVLENFPSETFHA